MNDIMPKRLPDKINEKFLIMSQNGGEILDLIKQYNALPFDSPQRRVIYEKIEDKVDYEVNWD